MLSTNNIMLYTSILFNVIFYYNSWIKKHEKIEKVEIIEAKNEKIEEKNKEEEYKPESVDEAIRSYIKYVKSLGKYKNECSIDKNLFIINIFTSIVNYDSFTFFNVMISLLNNRLSKFNILHPKSVIIMSRRLTDEISAHIGKNNLKTKLKIIENKITSLQIDNRTVQQSDLIDIDYIDEYYDIPLNLTCVTYSLYEFFINSNASHNDILIIFDDLIKFVDIIEKQENFRKTTTEQLFKYNVFIDNSLFIDVLDSHIKRNNLNVYNVMITFINIQLDNVLMKYENKYIENIINTLKKEVYSHCIRTTPKFINKTYEITIRECYIMDRENSIIFNLKQITNHLEYNLYNNNIFDAEFGFLIFNEIYNFLYAYAYTP